MRRWLLMMMIVVILVTTTTTTAAASQQQKRVPPKPAPSVPYSKAKPPKGPLRDIPRSSQTPYRHAQREDIVEEYTGNEEDLIVFSSALCQMVYRHNDQCLLLKTSEQQATCWHTEFAQYYSTGGCFNAPSEVHVLDTGEDKLRFRVTAQHWPPQQLGKAPMPKFTGFNNQKTQGLLALTMRGTDGLQNWMTDGEFRAVYPDGSTAVMSKTVTNTMRRLANVFRKKQNKKPLQSYGVHTGFNSIWKSVEPQIHQWLAQYKVREQNVPLLVTGHSMGGSVATLGVFKLREAGKIHPNQVRLVTIEAARVGKDAWVKAWTAAGLDRHTIRITNGEDVVPKIPPAMEHPTVRRHIALPCTKNPLVCHKMVEVQHGLRQYIQQITNNNNNNKPACSTWQKWLNYVSSHHQTMMQGQSTEDDRQAKQHLRSALQPPAPLHRTHTIADIHHKPQQKKKQQLEK